MAGNGPSVAVIGAGFGGLGVGIELLRAGFTNLTILERADGIGGVWRDNTYPNAACDVPSPLYSWSFAPNPRWGSRYSGQGEILDYIEKTAAGTGVLGHVRTGAEVTRAEYDDGRWRVLLADGETLEVDVLVPALGQLSRPVVPDVPGAATFAGPAFHSARWRHDVNLANRRVAVVGTGASAIQFVPGIVDEVGALTVFQRSAPYVVPKPDRTYRRPHHRIFERFPRALAAERGLTWVLSEQLNRALTTPSPWRLRVLALAHRALLRAQVRDPALRRRLRPSYGIGCKRILFSNDWYPALDRDHVDVVGDPVAAVVPHGVRTADGTVHAADVLVWGTGFDTQDLLGPLRITGAHGRDLRDEWSDGARAYLGICVPGFPNMFLVYGPNTNLGGSSILGMMEGQACYVVDALRALASRPDRPLDCRRDVADRFDDELQRRLARTAWASCANWYRDRTGRITTNWPGLVREYRDRTARLDLADFT